MPTLRIRILDHWRRCRPNVVRELSRSGELEDVVTNLEKTILEKRAVMLRKGMSVEEADERVRHMWMTPDVKA